MTPTTLNAFAAVGVMVTHAAIVLSIAFTLTFAARRFIAGDDQ